MDNLNELICTRIGERTATAHAPSCRTSTTVEHNEWYVGWTVCNHTRWQSFANTVDMGPDDKESYNDANTGHAVISMVFHRVHRMNVAPTTNDWLDSVPFYKSTRNAVGSVSVSRKKIVLKLRTACSAKCQINRIQANTYF